MVRTRLNSVLRGAEEVIIGVWVSSREVTEGDVQQQSCSGLGSLGR